MRSTGCAPRTLRVARGWLRCPARPRGVTFFQPQTQLLQQMPDPTQAERNARLTMQLGLQLSQRQIGFRCHPIHHLSLRRDTGTPLAPGLVPHPLGLPGAVPLCGDLLRPAHAHQEPIRKFLQRLLALIVSKQKLTAQVIPLWLRHRFTRRGSSPRQVYTIKKNALNNPSPSKFLIPDGFQIVTTVAQLMSAEEGRLVKQSGMTPVPKAAPPGRP